MTGPEAADAVAAALRSLAPPGIHTGARAVDALDVGALRPGERAAMADAVPKRLREFATGRALLRELVGRPVEIPHARSRPPQLPPGLVGTLSHDAEVAAAAVASVAVARSLGLDLEPARPLTPGEISLVVRPDEAGSDPRAVFVLKEAVYKAWAGLGGRRLDFHDVRVTVTGDRFSAAVLGGEATFGGRFAEAAGRWIALVVVA